jgi:hypothetical protein
MRDELARSRALRMEGLDDKPYYIEYALDDTVSLNVQASLGGIVDVRQRAFRVPQVQVRCGDYAFDNTNYAGTGMYRGSRYELMQVPLDDSYAVLRRYFWLATDRAFKSAVDVIGRKRAALKNVSDSDRLPDFGKAEPARVMLDISRKPVAAELWISRVRELSAIFLKYPEIRSSSVEFETVQDNYYLVNSEGTQVRAPDRMMSLGVRAAAQAPDGMDLHTAATFQSLDFERMPSDLELGRGVTEMAEKLTALTRAPAGEPYTGPVLFEGEAAAQIFAELLGKRLVVSRKPVSDPGRSSSTLNGEFEGRLGARVLPEFLDVVDDPTQTEWQGRPLFGHYPVDMEGVVPQPLVLVEKGVLKNFLLTRQPVRDSGGSNGRARFPGSYGARSATFGNLFVRSSQAAPAAELRKKMMEMCRQRNKPYGIIVRKMDFPSSASVGEIRRLLTGMAQSGDVQRAVSVPILVYRVYPDGKEELVRGLRFHDLGARALKDIVAASSETAQFDFLDNQAPFALMGAGGYVAECSVVAPSVLFDDLELQKSSSERQKLPVVPPPVATGLRPVEEVR